MPPPSSLRRNIPLLTGQPTQAERSDREAEMGVSRISNQGLRGLWNVAWVVALGCAAGEPLGAECEVGSDCESGACNDGVCVDEPGGTGGGGAGAGASGGAGGAGAASAGGAGGESSGGGGAGLCSPNEDGTIERAEVPIGPGLDAKYRVATDVEISTASTLVEGVPTWDLSGALAGDMSLLLETLPLTGQWFESSFPGASYAARLSSSADLLGVFEIDEDALVLRGVVSPDDGAFRTELEYDPPVTVLAFPLTEGSSWTTESTVSGLANGVFSFYTEDYASIVDERGDVVTPFSTFDALRVRIDLTRTVGALQTTQKTFAFVTECFGTVATIDSTTNESGDEFTDVSEIRRLTP
jgi:hypothetical protein